MADEFTIADYDSKLRSAEEFLGFKYLSIRSFSWYLFGAIGFRDEEEKDLPRVMTHDWRTVSNKTREGLTTAVRGRLVDYTIDTDRMVIVPGSEIYGRILASKGLTMGENPQVQERIRIRVEREVVFTGTNSLKPQDLTVIATHSGEEDYELSIIPQGARLPFGSNHVMTSLGNRINLRKDWDELCDIPF
jgi:hypothetical protein